MKRSELKQIIREVIEESNLIQEMSKASDIRDLIEANPNISAAEVADKLGISLGHARTAMNNARKKTSKSAEEPITAEPEIESSTKISPDQLVYKKTAAGKPLASREGATRVEAFIRNIDFPSNVASGIGSIASKLDRVKALQKKFTAQKKSMDDWTRGKMDELFPIGDEVLTRSLETTGFTIVVDKAASKKTFNKDIFKDLVSQNLGEENELVTRIFEWMDQAHKESNITPEVKITPKEEGIIDTMKSGAMKFKALLSKISRKFKEFVSKNIELAKATAKVVGRDTVINIKAKAKELTEAVKLGTITAVEATSQMAKFANKQ